MELIDKEKVVEKSWQQSCEISDKFENLGPLVSSIIGVEAGKCFGLGVKFAEKELEDFAIEFADFVIWNNFASEYKIEIKSNFQEFIEQRNK